MVGKTYWKSVAIPAILYGTGIVSMRKEDIGKLQRIENNVYRKILWSPSYAQIATLKGEIGSSNMTRILKNKVFYMKSILDRKSSLLKNVLEIQKNRNFKWMRNLKREVEEMDWSLREMVRRTPREVKEIFRKWDEKMWRSEMEEK